MTLASPPEAADRPTGKALVLGDDGRAALSIVRSLGARRLEIHLAKRLPRPFVERSRYVAAVHDLSGTAVADGTWQAAVKALMVRERYDLVLPCDDHSAIPLHGARHELEPLGRIAIPSAAAFTAFYDKLETTRLAAALDIGLPKWALLQASADADAEDLVARFGLPLVLKPVSSFDLVAPGRRRGVRKAFSPDEVRRALAALADGGPVLVQENFNGQGVGVELLAHEGTVLVAFQHERLHEGLHGSGSSYRCSAQLDPALIEAARKLVRATRYTGVMMVEFKVDRERRRWILIEVNARFWGSLPLAVAAGVDFPAYLYDLLVHGRRSFPQRYRVPWFCRNTWQDLAWLRQNLRADRADPRLQSRPLRQVALEPLNLLRESNDTFRWSDPAPALVEAGQFAGLALRRLAAGARFKVEQTILRGRRRRALRTRLRTARRVLFVCRGNICRSPFALAYARTLLPAGVQVAAAGYEPHAGRTAPAEAVAAAAELGIDLTGHRSTVLDGAQVATADVILVFDRHNCSHLRAAYPAARGKVFPLATLMAAGSLAIADPYGQDVEAFRACYRRIKAALDTLAPVNEARAPRRDSSAEAGAAPLRTSNG